MEAEFIRIGYRWWPQVMPWVFLVFWGWLTLKLIGLYGVSWLGLLVLGPVLLLNVGNIIRSFHWFEIDTKSIAAIGWFGRREMSWEEVQYIEVCQGRSSIAQIVFSKGDKRLIVNGPSDWWNINDKQVLTFLEGQVNHRGIKIYYSKPSMAIL